MLHGIKHQGIRLLNIKLLSLMHHDTRDLSISDLSRDLYLPITVANPRSNPSTLKGHRRWKMINKRSTYLDAKHDGVDGSTDEVLPATTHRKASLGQKEGRCSAQEGECTHLVGKGVHA